MTGFFDTFETTAGLNFVGKDEKADLIADSVPLTVVKVFSTESQYGPRYILVVQLDGEERAIGFGKGTVQSRDSMLAAMEAYLEGESVEPIVVKLSQAGRATIITEA
jgi:hypothetical protein